VNGLKNSEPLPSGPNIVTMEDRDDSVSTTTSPMDIEVQVCNHYRQNQYSVLLNPKKDRFKCRIDGCDFRVMYKHWLDVHQLEHKVSTKANPAEPNTNLTCPVCGLQFATRTIFESHLNRAHVPTIGSPSSFQCPFCYKYFEKSKPQHFSNLTAHIQEAHPSQLRPRKPYQKRQYFVPQKFQLRAKREAKLAKPVTPRQRVERRKPRRGLRDGDLNPEVVLVTPSWMCIKKEKDALCFQPATYKCDSCPREFSSRSQRNYHKRRVHVGPRFSCPKCQERFHQNRELIYHIQKSHPGAQKYSCKVCGWIFYREEDWKTHEKCHKPNSFICVVGKCYMNQFKIRTQPPDYGSVQGLRRHVQVAHGHILHIPKLSLNGQESTLKASEYYHQVPSESTLKASEYYHQVPSESAPVNIKIEDSGSQPFKNDGNEFEAEVKPLFMEVKVEYEYCS